MKGLELPVNMIIIIAIAVLVLVVVAAFFAGRTGEGFASISLEQAFTQGCAALRAGYECNSQSIGSVIIPGYKKGANDQTPHPLSEICADKGIPDLNACARACGCVVT